MSTGNQAQILDILLRNASVGYSKQSPQQAVHQGYTWRFEGKRLEAE